MKMMQKGFTLIELMIVIAIIAILAALALPAYQDYTGRAQFSEALSVADGLKTPVQEYLGQTGTCPSNTAAVGNISKDTDYQTKYLTKVTTGGTLAADNISGCTITATFQGSNINKKLQNGTVILTSKSAAGVSTGGSVDWPCTSSVPAEVRPTQCAASVAAGP